MNDVLKQKKCKFVILMNNIIDIEMKKISYYLRCAAIISSVGLILSS